MDPFFGRLSPEDRSELVRQARAGRSLLRTSYLRVAIVLYGAIVVFVLIVHHPVQDPLARGLLLLIALVATGVFLFARNPMYDDFDNLEGGC